MSTLQLAWLTARAEWIHLRDRMGIPVSSAALERWRGQVRRWAERQRLSR